MRLPDFRNRRAALPALALMTLLAGCGGFTLGGGSSSRPPETLAVSRGAVVVGGPQGYCIDRSASRAGDASPFVLLGSCASIARDARAGAPATQAGVLTATVSPPGEGPPFAETIARLERFFGSPAGRAALARDGRDRSVTVLETRRENGAMYVHLRDTSEDVVPGTGDTYWRGLFEVNGRLVTVSVMSFRDQPMGSDTALATLRGTIARIRRESARAPA